MNIDLKKSEKYLGSNGRFSLLDLRVPAGFNGELIVFAHGYMGYKDWGAWELMQKYFTERGFAYCRFNFSHNGGTVENPIDFSDPEAFAENNYSKEVFDLQQVLDYIEQKFEQLPRIHLIGHSRGGGIVLLNAADPRVYSVITLAAISSVAKRFSDQAMMKAWKEAGVRYVTNQRTKQDMPHNWSQAEDFEQNRELLSIENACKKLNKAILVIHGNQDTSVPLEEGREIAEWTGRELVILDGADHTFGAAQPWNSDKLPPKLEEACLKIEEFISSL
ncbi:MAG: alpha/beta hydrolase [Crocinitomicaceae bacterium]|jgi:pimeloyl-ACP methyl ester carboxylesterase|nr:alpha/beta hydrolase [Crocinitomicaceae bacterium]